MFARAATTLLVALAPLLAVAGPVVPAVGDASPRLVEELLTVRASDASGVPTQVVPLWASQDGRLLAIVAQTHSAGAPALPPSPAFGGGSDLRVIDATDLFSAGLRWRVGQSAHADVVIGMQEASPRFGSATFRDGSASTLFSGTLGFGVALPTSADVDLSFGLSWLGRSGGEQAAPIVLPSFEGQGNPVALLSYPGTTPFQIVGGNTLNARTSWHLADGPVLDLTAGVGRLELAPWYGLPGGGLDASQASLGFGIRSGSVRGSIVGHVVNLEDPSLLGARRWSGLDLGVSWRTSWRGELSVGAQNLWSSPVDLAPREATEAAQSRMPYVQYRQDL